MKRAKVAVGVTFVANGLAFAGWLARAPAVRDDLHLSAAGFGLLLLCLSVAAVATIPLAGPLVQRIGSARAVLLGSMSVVAGLIGLATGTALGSVVVAGIGLVLAGMGNSTWDVAMNVEGASVERHLGRTVMPRFHAGFSLGTILGSAVGVPMAALDVPIEIHITAVAVASFGAVLVAGRYFLPPPP